MNSSIDCIELSLPFKAEYVSVARLTASGVASRMGFDIEIIEDIKVAVAEVCNRLVHTGSQVARSFKISFFSSLEGLMIRFECEDKSLKCVFAGDDNELGISLINAFMDQVEFCSEEGYIISMSKTFEGE